MQHMGTSQAVYGLPLEEILDIEMNILSRPNLRRLLSIIETSSSRMEGWSDISVCASAYNKLQSLMEKALAGYRHNITAASKSSSLVGRIGKPEGSYFSLSRHSSGKFSRNGRGTSVAKTPSSMEPSQLLGGLSRYLAASQSSSGFTRVHTRRYGLLLNSLYVPQLCAWVLTEMLNTTSAKLMIAQSEHIFADRISFFHDHFLPFLHPSSSDIDKYVDKTGNRVAEELPIWNTKSNKVEWAKLSVEMTDRVDKFYRDAPLEPLLSLLSRIDHTKYVIVPSIADPTSNGWW